MSTFRAKLLHCCFPWAFFLLNAEMFWWKRLAFFCLFFRRKLGFFWRKVNCLVVPSLFVHKGGPGEHKVLKNAERWKNVLLKSRLKTGNRPGTHFQKDNSSERGRGIPRFESNWNVCPRKEEIGAWAIYSERMVLNHMELRTKLQKQPLYIGGKRPAGALSSWTSIKWPPGLKVKKGERSFYFISNCVPF